MDNPSDAQTPAQKPPTKTSSPAKTTYLILYNAISALLWLVVLGRVVLIESIHGYRSVYTGTGEFTKWTQTLAGLEVLHAALGTPYPRLS